MACNLVHDGDNNGDESVRVKVHTLLGLFQSVPSPIDSIVKNPDSR